MNFLSVILFSSSVPSAILRGCIVFLSLCSVRWFFEYLRYRKIQRDINRITSDDELR